MIHLTESERDRERERWRDRVKRREGIETRVSDDIY